MSDGSDIELPSALPKKSNKKMPPSPSEDLLKKNNEPKRYTTKIMINQALIDLKTRKGVSLYAIKKYLTEKYSVDTEKINYFIKKYLKTAVQEGKIVQLKGNGASGSFKLVPEKETKKKSKPSKSKEEKENAKKTKKSAKPKKSDSKSKKVMEKSVKSKTKIKENETEEKTSKLKKKIPKEKVQKDKKVDGDKVKKVKVKIAKEMQTPAKKRAAMMKRKSIGSIIKPPKMKPKAKA